MHNLIVNLGEEEKIDENRQEELLAFLELPYRGQIRFIICFNVENPEVIGIQWFFTFLNKREYIG